MFFSIEILMVLLLFAVLTVTSGQFLEQPDAGTVFVPVHNQVTLTCSVEEGYIADWHVLLSNGDEVEASGGLARQTLMKLSFTLEGVATSRFTLSLRETVNQTNNGTNITCLAVEKDMAQNALITGNSAVIFFYDSPPPPTDLKVTEDELGSLNISWSLGFIEGVPVNYTLTVLNLNTTSAQPIIIAGLLDQHYVLGTSRPCDVYSFTVTAVTAAGNSTPSQELIFTFTWDDSIEIQFATITINQSTVKVPTIIATTESFDVDVYIGTATAASVVVIAVTIIIITFYCYCKQKRKTARNCIKDKELQHHMPSPCPDSEDADGELYCMKVSLENSQHPLGNGSEGEAEMNALHTQGNAIKQKVDDAGVEVGIKTLYSQVGIYSLCTQADECKNEEKVLMTDTVLTGGALYAEIKTEFKKSAPNCSEIGAKVAPLYVQVDKTKTRLPVPDKSQSLPPLHPKVDKSKKSSLSNNVNTEAELLYAQVNKSKNRSQGDKKMSAQPNTALYAKVDKAKVRPLYAQVDKSRNITEEKALASEKSHLVTLYAEVDKYKKKRPGDNQKTEVELLLDARVDKSKSRSKNESAPDKPQPMAALYAEVEKSENRKKYPPSDDHLKLGTEALYAQVNKSQIKSAKANDFNEEVQIHVDESTSCTDPTKAKAFEAEMKVLHAHVCKIQHVDPPAKMKDKKGITETVIKTVPIVVSDDYSSDTTCHTAAAHEKAFA